MPEIAEVRVVANTLKKQILNKSITKVRVLYDGIIVGNCKTFIEELENKKISDITTCGKWLIFNLGDLSILSHLRMEGKYFYVPSDTKIDKHIHVVFTLDNGMDLRYQDTRKFGKMELVKTSEVYETECIKKLGIEPDDKRLNGEYLLTKLRNKNKPIKELLLDQTIINGLGNIYANEVLFASGINPFRKSSSITLEEANRIVKESSRIITKSYEMGGCTIRSYTSSLGVIGHYQDELKVQSRESLPCPNCNTPISRIRISGRSTFYCKNCQK